MIDVLEKVKVPAIGLMVTGVLNGVIGVFTLFSGLLRLTGLIGQERLPTNEAEKLGFIMGTAFGYGIALIGLLAAPLIFYGGFRMLKGKSYKLSKTGAILAIIPLVSCCFPVGMVFGIWALTILSRAEVRAFFNGESPWQSNFPPPPGYH
ncbi:MAG: hypothetical protein R2747_17605 [Pyrinomonadaceae bacterium]